MAAASRRRLRRDAREVRAAGCDTIVLEDDWEAFLAARRRGRRRRAAEREATLDPTTRSTSSSRRAPRARPRARRSPTATSSTTPTSPGARWATRERDRVVRAGAALPHVRHGDRHPRVRHPRRVHGPAGRVVRAAAVLEAVEAERCTSLYGVPTMFIAELADRDFERYDLSSLRTGAMGGAPCPVEVMQQVRSRMHMDEVAIVCGMTETSPVSTQTAPDDPLDEAGRHRRPRAPARRGQDRRPGDRRDRPARRRRASSAPAATA